MIHVFKTSVATQEQVLKIQPVLNSILPDPSAWNFDLEDCDLILRISVDENIAPQAIISAVTRAGFCCEELAD